MRRCLLVTTLLYLLINTAANAQLQADFSANTLSGCDFEQINFTNLSTDGNSPINCAAGYSYQWDFNPGNSTQCNPGNIFSTPGTYTICLTVTNDGTGESHTECKPNYITIFPLPVPDFTFSPDSGCEPLTVCFENTSTLVSGSFSQCLWDFADGTVVSDCSLSPICHTFEQGGEFDVSLTVIDNNGCPPVTAIHTVTVDGAPEIGVVANNTSSCNPPLGVNFINTSPVVADVTFEWLFEEADIPAFTGTTPPTITWNSLGTFDVTVIATGDLTGCTDTLLLEDYISIGSVVNFVASSHDICLGDTIFFFDQSAGGPTSWTWDFGDNMGTSAVPFPFYVYGAPGCYEVSLTADNGTCASTYTDPVCITVSEPPALTFSNDNPVGCELPHNVNFTAGNVANADTYIWVVGGDTLPINSPNVSHTFVEFGSHTVALTVTTSSGCVAYFDDIIEIQPLDADLPGDYVLGCAPVTATLTDASSSVAPITDWVWTIEGIGTFNEESPTVTAVDTGEYDVILQVTNSLGCVDTDTFPAYIQTGAPQEADFEGFPLISCVDSVVNFVDLSSEFADQWFWEFGEGPLSTSAEQNPAHEYIDTGTFTVCLTVFQNGCPNTICKEDYLTILPPNAGFNTIQSCDTPYFYEFEDLSIGADSVFWDFGVGGTDTDTSTFFNPVFTFPDTGVYTVTQTVFNFETGCDDSEFIQVYVTTPEAIFAVPDSAGCAPFTVMPTDLSQFAVLWAWSSDNGVIDDPTSPTPSITYNDPGVYSDISLTITDINGCTSTSIYTDSVYVNAISADFDISPPVGCVPLEVTLTDISSNLLYENVEWEWAFGDGTGFAFTETVTHTYTFPDTFNIRLTVRDELGCEDTRIIGGAVQATQAVAAFEGDTVACGGQEITFSNFSTGQGLTYFWDFGDDSTSTEPNPMHSYDSEGFYTVCLTATDVNGCDSTLCLVDYVHVLNPTADFVADTTFAACPPLVVSFTNLSGNSSSGGFIWDFGDDTGLSGADNPSHVYTGAGTFDVTLISTSPSACQDTMVLEDYIQLNGPVGNFTFEQDTGCVPFAVTFYTSSISPVLHIMDYGDGNIDSSAMAVMADTFTYIYAEAGDFVPALILVDAEGCDQVFDSPVPIVAEHLTFNFFASDTLLCDGGDTNFSSFISSSEPITFLEWTFEGQSPPTSNDPNPSVNYSTYGQYDVTLEVSNGVCMDSLTKEEYIVIESVPTAAFSPDPATECEPATVVFNDESSVTPGLIVDWNWTFGDGGFSDLQSPSHTYNSAGTYNVELSVLTENGCADTTSATYEVLPVPIVSVDDGETICIGESFPIVINLNIDPATATYEWSNAATLDCPTCANPLATPTVTTTYTVTVTAANGCTATDDMMVDVLAFAIPDINLNPDTTICLGTEIQLIAQGGATPFSYEWSNEPGLSCYNCANPFAAPTSTTTYVVTVTADGGCADVDSVQVSVIDPSYEFAGPDRIVCQGDTVVLDYGGVGNNPQWTPADGLGCQFCPYPVASPNDTTLYFVTVEDPVAGCPITDSVLVSVIPLGALDAGADVDVCRGDPVQLSATGFGDLTWTPTGVFNNPGINNPVATVSEDTWLYVSATNDACVMTDSLQVSVLDSATVLTTDVVVCEGDSAYLLAIGNADSYTWSPSTGLTNANIPDPVALVDETTIYTVQGTLGTCPSTIATATVQVDPLPVGDILPIHEFHSGQAVQIGLEVPPNSPYIYEWYPNVGLDCSDCQNPMAAPDTTGYYNVIITDAGTGCSSEYSTLMVELGECSPEVLAVPNAFTPNGDGRNDVLYVRSTSVAQIEMFRIFDRWGNKVFETNNISVGWDGTYNGKPVNTAVFVYYVEGICPLNGSKLLKKGNVMVLR